MKKLAKNKSALCNIYTFDQYKTILDVGDDKKQISLELFFYFNEKDKLVRVSFGKDDDFSKAVSRPHPQFIKNFQSFFERKKPFNYSILEFEGTAFQKEVWQEIIKIPCGETLSYKEIAEKINRPRASRAVGAAAGKNRFVFIVPCHRVLNADKSSVGKFAGKKNLKKALLENEGVFLSS